MNSVKIGFIGCGNMGSAIATRVAINQRYDVYVSDYSPQVADSLAAKIGGSSETNYGIAEISDYIFLAVKPQVIESVLDEISPVLKERKTKPVIISMAAGISISRIREITGGTPVIRIMPNTPVTIGSGMIVYSLSEDVSGTSLSQFIEFMSRCGKLDRISEEKIDAATAIHGCGPAYVYMFANAMADAGVANGLTKAQAIEYSAQTLIGAAQMILQSGKHPMELKDNVCSPGGSTIAGVLALDEYGFTAAVEAAVDAAYKRTVELGK